MKSLTNATNGFMIISDSFITAIFKQSFLRTFGKDEQGWLKMGFNGTFEVLVRIIHFSVSSKRTLEVIELIVCMIRQLKS